MLYRLSMLLPLLILFDCAAGAPESATALDEAQKTQQKMRNHTTDIFKQADAVSRSPGYLDELNQSPSTYSESVKSFPKATLPDLPNPDPTQLARARVAIGRLLDQAEHPKGGLTEPSQTRGSQFYIFVSFSMPQRTLRRLMKQARRIDAPLVLRGLVGNDMNQTRLKISQLLGADKQGKTRFEGGLSIDPTLYQRFGITVVPAFVLTEKPVPACTQAGCVTPDFVRLAGNITVDYALEAMGKAAPTMRGVSETLLGRSREQTP